MSLHNRKLGGSTPDSGGNSLVSRSGSERVCVVTVEETDGGSESASKVVAAHTSGGNGNLLFGVPTTMSQAMEHDDSEYWKAVILDEITNHHVSCFLKSW